MLDLKPDVILVGAYQSQAALNMQRVRTLGLQTLPSLSRIEAFAGRAHRPAGITLINMPAMAFVAPRPTSFRGLTFALLFAGVVLLFLLELMIGPVRIPLRGTVAALTGGLVERDAWRTIIWTLRLPRAFTTMLAGAALAAAGLQMQTMFRNPLADPWLLGIVSGARLGVACVATLVSLAGMGILGAAGFVANISLIGAAMAGAAAALAVLIALSRRVGVVTLLILGLVSDYVVSGLIRVVLHFTTEVQGQALNRGMMGASAV